MGRTFITEGNMSLCIRYVKRLVWYAPDVMARATLTALCRISTMCPRQHLYVPAGPSASGRGTGPHSLLLPLRIMESNELTKSVKTASIWSRPASTVMISELGFVYFLERTAERKMLRVCSRKRHQHTLHKPAIWVEEALHLAHLRRQHRRSPSASLWILRIAAWSVPPSLVGRSR